LNVLARLAITAEQWQRVGSLFDRLSTLPPDERALDTLDEAPAVRELLERMLAAHDTDDAEALEATFGGAVEALLDPASESREPERLDNRRFGPWRTGAEIGRGGMGVVHHGERADDQFEKQVAIKLLPAAGARSERLREEIRILAQLEHPHIAWLLDGGVSDDGIPYLVMEFVDGTPIDRYCREHGLSALQITRLFEQAVEAVRFAHRHLIVHCDLKPGNILVTRDGQVKLVDFGIAGLLAAGTDETLPVRGLMCSPAYAAPEQLAGERPATSQDIYSLGAVLYELLCGHRVRDAASATRLLFGEGVRLIDPQPPSARNARVDRDLDTICLRALSNRPESRYPTASALLADLENWRRHYPVMAREGGAGYRTGKWLRRHWLPASAGAAAAVALAAGAGVALWQAQQARVAQTAAETELERATALNDFIIELFEGARIGPPREEVPTTRDILIAGAEEARVQFADQPAIRGEMLALIGRLLNSIGLADESRRVLADALAVQSALDRPPPALLAETRLEYGKALHFSDRFDEAIDTLDQAVNSLRDRGDPTLLADALHALGFALSERQRWEQALAAHREALDLQAPLDDRRAFGYGQAVTARTLARSGALERADRLYRQALQNLRAAPDTEAHTLALALSDHAVTLRRLDRHREAERALRESIAISEDLYTGPHTSMAQRWNNLGSVLFGLGDRPAAIEAFEHAAAILEALPGDGQRSVLAGPFNNLGFLSMSVGRYEQAEDYFDRALALLEASTGREHSNHIATTGNLGRNLALMGEHDRAEALLEDALERARRLFGPDAGPVTGLSAALGQTRWLRDRDPEGLAMIERAYRTTRDAHGEDDPNTVRRALDLAEALALAPDPDRARPLYQFALAYSAETLPEAHPQVLTARAGLAETLLALDDVEAAAEVLGPLGELPPAHLAETDPLRGRLLALGQRLP
jgi:serine/threonine-protein kinase